MKYLVPFAALYIAACLGLIGAMALSTYDAIHCDTNVTVSIKR